MPHNPTRDRLEFLHDRILRCSSDISVSDDNELRDEELRRLSIHRIPFNPELLHDRNSNMSQNPPIFFQAMSEEDFAHHPIDSSLYGENGPDFDFREYHPVPNPYDFWSPSECAIATLRDLGSYLGGFERENVPDEAVSLVDLRGLEDVRMPNSLFLYTSFSGSHSVNRGRWTCRLIIEPERINGQRVRPHLVLGVTQSFNGHENTMMYGELAAIVDAMHGRSQQQIIPEQEEEAVHDIGASPPEGPRAFERERRFPVLILSFLGPQHARVFYACMNHRDLVIRQSQLYSFERWSTAPMDLFARLALSQPLDITRPRRS